jgi:nucleoside-diphosphate-sugar epimerase
VSKKKVLVLGGSGFVGRELLKALLINEDKYTLTVLEHKNNIDDQPEGTLRLIQGDLFSANWNRILADPPDIVFHLARLNARAFGSLGRLVASLKGYWANRRLKHALEKTGYPINLIYLSGSLMYGEGLNLNESSGLHPVSFAREYQIAEKPFNAVHKNSSLTSTMVRVPWVMGFGSWYKSFYHDTLKDESRLRYYSHDDFRMMFIDVEDLANAFVQIGNMNHKGALNVFMPEEVTYKTFMNFIQQAYNPDEMDPFNEENIRRDYQFAIAEAFTKEITLSTLYPHLHAQFNFQFQNAESMLKARLGQFAKNK